MTRSVLYYGVSAFLVIYLVGRVGAAPAVAGLALTAFTTAGAFATLASSRITVRLGRVRTLLASYVLGALAFGGLLATTSPVLVRNPGRLITKQHLLHEVWGPGYDTETNYLRLYLAQLRRKLEPDPGRPSYLLTETGMGYRFRPDETEAEGQG